MDWIVKLLLSRKPITEVIYNLIFVIIDLLTKYAYFIPYIKKSGAEELIY